MDNDDRVSTSDFLIFVKSKIILFVTIFALVLGAGLFYVWGLKTPEYSSTAKIMVHGLSLQKGNINTYQNIITSKNFVEDVISESQITDRTVGELSQEMVITGEAGSSVLLLSVHDHSDELATRIANAAAELLTKNARKLGLTDSSDPSKIEFSILESASDASRNTAGDSKILFGTAVAGFGLALAIIYIMYLIDGRIYSENNLDGIVQAKFISRITKDDDVIKIQSNISPLRTADSRKIIMLTAPSDDRNKEKIALKLAAFYGASGYKTLFMNIDKNISRKLEGYDAAAPGGITNIIESSHVGGLGLAIKSIRDGFDYIGIGSTRSNIGAMLIGTRADSIFNRLRSMYDVIIINSSNLHDSSDSLSVTKYTDINLLVATSELARVKDVKKAVTSMEQVDAEFTGIALVKK